MSLRLVCGRAGTGKSNFCLEEIKQKILDKERIYIITPEQYSFTAEQKLLEKLEVGSSLNAEVLTFARMAHRILTEVGGVTKPSLSKAGRAMLIYDILDKEKEHFTFLGKTRQNTSLMETQLTELKKHAISSEMLNNTITKVENRYLQEKLKDIMLVYEKQEEKLQGKYMEENDRLAILANKLQETHIFDNAIFYIDEFNGFTKQEYQIIEALLKVGKEVTITITTDNLDLNTNIENDLFYESKQTADKVLYLARKNEIECKKTVFLEQNLRSQNDEMKHLEQNIQAIPYNIYQKEVKNLSIFLAKNPYTEVEYVAMQIAKLVREENYRYKDIIVMTKEMEPYSSLCKAIFNTYQIPVFLDEKKELSQNEFAKWILSLLEIYATNWSYDSVIQYLKLGFSNISDEELYEFENYTRKWGIKGAKWYQKEWNFGQQTDEAKEQAKRMMQIKEKIIPPLFALKQNLAGRKKAGQINTQIYEFIMQNKMKEQIEQMQKKLEEQGKIELAKEQELAWNIVMQVLDEIEALFGKDNITFEKYRELLKIGLSELGLGKIPQTQDEVMVGSLDRSKTSSVKAVFVLGMNDGVFPSIQKQEGFLNDEDRKKLKNMGMELAKGSLENLYADNFAIYKALTIAQEKIFFSYPSSNMDGGALRPSTYITKLKKIFPQIEEKSDLIEPYFTFVNENNTFEELLHQLRKEKDEEKIEEIWHSVEEYFSKKEEWKQKLEGAKQALNYQNEPEIIKKENIEKLYGNTLVTSVSKLERYRSCPFSYYLQYGLKLKPKEEYKIQPIDTGSFMHEVIDTFFIRLKEQDLKIKELKNEEIEKIVEEIIEEKLGLEKYYLLTSSDKFKILTIKLKRAVKKSMQYIIEGLKNSDFEVFATELEFKKGKEYEPITLTLEDGRKVEITGKIDRIDLAKTEDGNYIRIIDYKSSIKNIDLNQVEAGLQIQLLTYLDAACKIENMLPAGILYYGLVDHIYTRDKKVDEEKIEQEIRKNFKMKGLILADVNIIRKMDTSLTNGYSTIVPVRITKNDKITERYSSVATKEQFEGLMKHTNRVIKEISKEILSGQIKIQPYYQKKTPNTPCEYCEYKSICHFKEDACHPYYYIANDKKQDILERMKEEK